ncbi:fumarylacetoacetate hydrolase family protein [Bradyrhizobium sp.]|uniref:fumarylacetoacetate hydrolase family protein n=1 Tax=Bradyrhizobium sp. TaxID=376 RepID=UPI0039E7072A
MYDVSSALDRLPSYRWPFPPGDALIRRLDSVREAVGEVRAKAKAYRLDQVRLLSPVANPSKVMAAPANYRLHVEIDAADPAVHHNLHNKQLEGVERPVEKLGLFLKANSSISGPHSGVRLNWLDRRNDFEAELCVVIGKTCRRVSADRAFDYVAGYCVGLDMTVRGAEDRSFRKSADTYCVLGPWLTTADDVRDPANLDLWLKLNGDYKQKSSTGAMTVGIARLIELASDTYTLHPGDVIMTGTPEGVGSVKPGDIISAGCDGLGAMTVPVHGD